MPLPIAIVIDSLTLYIIFVLVRKSKFSFVEALIVVSSFATVAIIVFRHVPEFGIAAIITNSLSVIILSIVSIRKTRPFLLSIAYAFMSSLILILSGNLSGATLSIIYLAAPGTIYIGRDAILSSLVMSTIYTSIAFVFGFAIAYWFGRIFNAKLQPLDQGMKKRVSVFMFFGITIALLLFYTNTLLQDLLIETAMLNIVYAISLLGLFMYFIFVKLVYMGGMYKEIELRHQEELVRSMEDYTKQIEELSLGLRTFRHDHLNLLLNFRTHIENKNWEGMNSWYNDYVGEISIASTSMENCLAKLARIESKEIKNLFLVKFVHANHLGVNTKIDVKESVKISESRTLLDAIRLIGIYMDNAIEACHEVEDAKLSLVVTENEGIAHFVIANTCHDPPPINKLSQKGFSTKGEGRGMGIYAASQILSKSKKIAAQTSIKDGEFIQNLSISM